MEPIKFWVWVPAPVCTQDQAFVLVAPISVKHKEIKQAVLSFFHKRKDAERSGQEFTATVGEWVERKLHNKGVRIASVDIVDFV